MSVQIRPMPDLAIPALHQANKNGNGAYTPSPPFHPPSASRSPAMRPALPNRDVTAATIEDAYVDFILHCNPAVPAGADTTALREAFRTPPKSGGKSFSTFTLYDLICQLERKELKTWAELALKLGVEPPDQDKGQSSQKIQQYAVRLKRWMHSMHVDTFFKYLINSPHPYWTDIPTEMDPSLENGRDGVAAEDDMALRALLPHIRPRRGRKRPEEDELSRSPSQRPRIDDTPVLPEDVPVDRPFQTWSAHPDSARQVIGFQRLNPGAAQTGGGAWGPSASDYIQTPMSAFPRSAITPSTRASFWADEPQSAITPSGSKTVSKRHGAKVVSSAWRSTATGKTRGRPPMNRQSVDGPFSAFPTTSDQTFKLPSPRRNTVMLTPDVPSSAAPAALTIPPTDASLRPPDQSPSGSRPRPNRLSLQVPQRQGGEVRLATPPLAPPVVMVNGQHPQHPQRQMSSDELNAPNFTQQHPNLLPADLHNPIPHAQNFINTVPSATMISTTVAATPGTAVTQTPFSASSLDLVGSGSSSGSGGSEGTSGQGKVRFLDPSDTTNLDGLQAFWVHEIVRADWVHPDGTPDPTGCNVDEAFAIANRVLDTIRLKADTPESFLMNVAVLCGGKILMTTTKLRCTRLNILEDRTEYRCKWEMRLRDIRATYTMEETVMHRTWKKVPSKKGKSHKANGANGRKGSGQAGVPESEELQTAEMWQQKYKNLLDIVEQREKTLAQITVAGLESLREHARERDGG